MNENKLFELLNNMDDDLIESEIDKLLEGVEIDMNSINKKAHQKLNDNNKKNKRKKMIPYVAAACVCCFGLTIGYADDISQALKGLFEKTTVYSTVVDGDAYYLKDSYSLDNNIKLDSVLISKGNIEIKLTSSLSEKELCGITIVPKNNPKLTYSMGGYSEEDGKYMFTFMNKAENNYNIVPFKDFKLNVGGKSYDVSLQTANKVGSNEKISVGQNNIKGVTVGAKATEKNNKLNVQIITSFEDKDLQLDVLGKPEYLKVSNVTENKDSGILSGGTSCKNEDIYAYDESNNKYKLNIPKDANGRPVTIFETDASKDKHLSLKLPAVVATYPKTIDSFKLDIPKSGETVLNKDLDFKLQKALMKKITRISENKAIIEFELNKGENKNINIRQFDFYSKDVKKISSEFDGNKATVTLEFDKNPNSSNIEVSYPSFVINGNWTIDMK